MPFANDYCFLRAEMSTETEDMACKDNLPRQQELSFHEHTTHSSWTLTCFRRWLFRRIDGGLFSLELREDDMETRLP